MKKFYTCKYDRPFKIIFLNPKNKELLRKLLETILKVEIKEIKYLNTEITPDNIYIRGKRLDALLETNEGQIGIEVNARPKDYIHPRNTAFLCDRYANYVEVGHNYYEDFKIIQINLSYGLKDNKRIRIYKIQDEEGKEFVKNFIIYEINMDYYQKIWENKNEEEIEKNKYLIMQNLKKEELKKWSKQDKEIREYMEKIEKLNENNKFREYMTYEEDEEKIHNSLKEEGFREGIKKKSIEIAKKLLKENIPIDIISKTTSLSIDEIERLN
jgi:predicted transposase/invertase (TIGR01784 family)